MKNLRWRAWPLLLACCAVLVGQLCGDAQSQIGEVGYQSQQQTPIPETPTPVVEGVLTRTQQIHSQIFSKQYEGYRHGSKLRDIPGSNDTRFIIGIPNSIEGMPPYHELLKQLTCQADAVLIGVISSKTSALTMDGTFVFTDYELNVEDALKNNRVAAVSRGTAVTITRPGGAILLNGRRIQVTDSAFMPLRAGGRYILFLKYLPTSGAYMNVSSKTAFEIRDNKIMKLTKESLVPELEGTTSVEVLLTEVRANSANSCN
jgi:hypothetical protein